MPRGQKAKHEKQKQYCNKFNKDFKNGLHQKQTKKTLYKKNRTVFTSQIWPKGHRGVYAGHLIVLEGLACMFCHSILNGKGKGILLM